MRPLFFYLRNLNSYSLTVIVPKQKNIYITINQQYNYRIKNYSIYWLSIENLNRFLYVINGGQFARIITFIER